MQGISSHDIPRLIEEAPLSILNRAMSKQRYGRLALLVPLIALFAFVINVISPATPTPAAALISMFPLALLFFVSLFFLPALLIDCAKSRGESLSLHPLGLSGRSRPLLDLICILRC